MRKSAVTITAMTASVILFVGCELIPADEQYEQTEQSDSALPIIESSAEGSNPDSGTGFELTESFYIADYIEFDDAQLSGCSFIEDISIPLADDAAVARAIGTYRSSELYGEALEFAETRFTLENGEPVMNSDPAVNDDPEYPLWLAYGYYDYLTAEAGALDLRCDIVASVRYRLDGENEESIVVLRVPLPHSWMEWSGNSDFHVPVYVNADGDAKILYDVCSQDYSAFRLLRYTDGTVHAYFDFGHNESGHVSAIYAFKDGAAELKLSGCPVSVYRNMLLGGFGWDTFEPFLLDTESGEFCALAAVEPSAELAEILCSDKTVLTYVPNARELYESGSIQIIGGKYVTFATGALWSDNTFIYNNENRCFERVATVTVTGTALPDTIKGSYNVRV